ncbi:MAG: hypothetical protein SV062_06735, partial [Thermodesulfobacteriota bacterium]|nr:hypothetical protein [Thermodesulfobacteriota bacterium]
QVDTPYLEKKVNTFIADTGIENLKLLSGGESVPNPFALITSRRFETILSICKNNFDYILMDSPPIFIADSIVLSRYSDGTIFVIRSDKTRPTQAKKAFEILKGSGANVLGVVLNGVDPTRGRYSYYYNYGEYYKEKVS